MNWAYASLNRRGRPASVHHRNQGSTLPNRRHAGLPSVSARIRILLWCALLLAATLASSVVVTRVILFRHLSSEIDTELVHEVDEVDQLRVGGVDPVTKLPFVQADALLRSAITAASPLRSEELLAISRGKVISRTPAHPLLELERNPRFVASWSAVSTRTFGTVQTTQGTVRYLAVPVALGTLGRTPGDVFVAAKFVDGDQGDVTSTINTASVVGLAVLLIAIFLAWLIAGRMLGPVRDLEVLARSITDVDLTHRLDVRSNDEIGRLATAFNSMLDRVESAFRSQSQFIDDAGHELRTPITVIRGNLELLELDDVEQGEVRVVMLDELDRMGRMVNDLLLLARAERPDFLHVGTFQSTTFAAEIQAKVHGLADRTWIDGGQPEGAVVGDRHRLTQAWMQLAQNAVQHTDRGDAIELGSDLRDGTLEIWVGDSGPGVAVDDRDAIFHGFARSGDGHRDGEHYGLGLPIVRAIAEAHQGSVTVLTSALGGALFIIAVPVGDQSKGYPS
jgi:two-component system OmpR family sensor kinase